MRLLVLGVARTVFKIRAVVTTARDADAGLQQGDCSQPSDQWASLAGDSRQRACVQGWPRLSWILPA